MALHISYSKARQNLAKILDEVTKNRETVVIKRRGRESVVMISEKEATSLFETACLLRSPRNAIRLLSSIERALKGDGGVRMTVEDIEKLRNEAVVGERGFQAHMRGKVEHRRDDERMRVRFSKLRREKEQSRLEPDDLARGDGAMHEHFPRGLGPVGEEIPEDRFIEDAPWGGEAENQLSHGLHCALRLHYS